MLVGYANLGLTATGRPRPLPTRRPRPRGPGPPAPELAEQLVRLIETLMPALGEDDARVHELAAQLTNFLRQPRRPSPPCS